MQFQNPKTLIFEGENSKNFNKALDESQKQKWDYHKDKKKSLKQLDKIMKIVECEK